jgi:hypothetical protein
VADKIELQGVRVTPTEIAEIDSGRLMLSIPRQDIRGLSLCYGARAEHPIRQIIAGTFLIFLGLIPIPYLIYCFEHGGVIFEPVLFMLGFAAIGIWIIFHATSKGNFLEVETVRAFRKIVFHGRVESAELEAFVAAIETIYECKVRRAGGLLSAR